MLSENPNSTLLAESKVETENVIFLYSQTDEYKNSKYIKILNLIMFFSVFFSDDANFIVWENVLIGFILVNYEENPVFLHCE